MHFMCMRMDVYDIEPHNREAKMVRFVNGKKLLDAQTWQELPKMQTGFLA